MKVICFLKKYLSKHIKAVIVYFSVSLLVTIISIVNPYLTGKLINTLTDKKQHGYFIYYIAFIGIAWGIYIIFEYLNNIISARLQMDLTYAVVSDAIEHVHETIFNKVSGVNPMYLNQRISQDAGICVTFFIQSVIKIVNNIAMSAIIILLMISLSAKITLYIFPFIIIYNFLYVCIKKPLSIQAKNNKEAQNSYFTKMGEQLQNVKFVKMYSANKFFQARLVKAYNNYKIIALKFRKLVFALTSLDSTVKCAANLVLFFVGGKEVLNGNMTIGMFIVFSNYFPKLINSLSFFFQIGKTYQETLVSYNRLLEITHWETEINGSYTPDRIDNIRVSNLSFNYNNKCVLKNLNFYFEKGKTYAIVGPNGVGKSTLVQSIIGLFINDTRDEILINDVPIASCNMRNIREQFFSIVEQEPLMLEDSIETNIYLSNRKNELLKDDIIQILGLNTYINTLPNGINTIISSNNSISGGEKQKICIARTLIKNTEVMIFDEPTSALDKEATNQFLQYIDTIKKNKIVIFITHNHEITDFCDEVLDLANN